MRTTLQILMVVAMFIAASLQTHAQGAFIYDQQSATDPISPLGNGSVDGLYIQTSPLMQSFIPSLSTIGFVQFEFEDVQNNGNNGATVYVNLWSGSPNVNSATLVGSTTPVYMPDGFVNNGLLVAGITNFFFSTPIAVTPGQTYYLQPVVQSGDNPWAIVTIGDTYPNGRLYDGSSGGFFQPSTDLWFREGIISVPEPSTLALIGLSGILIFVRKRCRGFLIVAGLSFAIAANAQTYFLQSFGNTTVPFPYDPYGGAMPMITLNATNHVYLIADTPEDYAQMQSMNSTLSGGLSAMDVPSPMDLGGGYGSGEMPSFPQWSFPTNGLWLENLNLDPSLFSPRLHNTAFAENYQLLSTTNLLNTNWDLGEILRPTLAGDKRLKNRTLLRDVT